jgi:hypothetical protein
MQSIVQQRGNVKFPEFMVERVYMREFYKDKGLLQDLKRWQNTVDAMLDGISTDEPIYLMIDQAFVKSGFPHRRPGVHIDGYWNPCISAHGGHRGISAHGGMPSHNAQPTYRGTPRHGSKADTWSNASYEEKEGIILASSVSAAIAYAGEYEGKPANMGDCAHIDVKSLEAVQMQSNIVYAGNVT